MDDLDQREAFLKAIFATPDDDLPRLVFADWLDERGESAWAELIRIQCELARLPQSYVLPDQLEEMERRDVLVDRSITLMSEFKSRERHCRPQSTPALRGFPPKPVIVCTATDLGDPVSFRGNAILNHPEWYGASALQVTGGCIASSKPIGTILNSPVTQKVTRLDLSGSVVEATGEENVAIAVSSSRVDEYDLRLTDFTYHPTVTLQAVEALVNARECRRFTHLDLRNNDLDNDAARVILRSTNLTRLQSLHLFDGNRLRGRTWAQLVDRFGEENVS